MAATEFIRVVDISKRFGSTQALRNVSFDARLGEVHAVVGENGAGKSTLMHVLYGMIEPDSGALMLEGRKVSIRTSREALALGIGMVHQHFSLAYDMTVLENIMLGAEPVSFGLIDAAKARKQITAICERLEITLDLQAKVSTLSVAVKQRVEIVKALFRGARLLILDEPTALLTPTESDSLLRFARHLCSTGVAVILVSHKLPEVMRSSDRISVMRQGVLVTTLHTADTNEQHLAAQMVEGELPPSDASPSQVGPTRLEVRGLSTDAGESRIGLQQIDIDLHAGEITAVLAAAGNGETELLEALSLGVGVRTGQVRLNGQHITRLSSAKRYRAGLKVLPPDRHSQALFLSASIADNLRIEPCSRWWEWFIPPERRVSRSGVQSVIETFRVRGGGPEAPLWALSGGNQQKVALARILSSVPQVLLVANPTRGVDMASSAFLHDQLRQAKMEGVAIALFTYDLTEALDLADRFVVLYGGRVAGLYRRDEVTLATLGSAMLGLAEPAGRGE